MKNVPETEKTLRRRFLNWPGTRLGWWALGLAVLFELLMLLNSAVFMHLSEEVTWRTTLLPFYGIFMMLCGIAAGIAALLALVRRGERSFLVWLALLPGLFATFFLLGEFLLPH